MTFIFCHCFSEKIRLDVTRESSIHVKNQALFSAEDKSKKLKCHLLQFLFGAFGVKPQNLAQLRHVLTRISGSMDPYQRAPRSPRGKKPQPFEGSNPTLHSTVNEDGARSPTSDQVRNSPFVSLTSVLYNVSGMYLRTPH